MSFSIAACGSGSKTSSSGAQAAPPTTQTPTTASTHAIATSGSTAAVAAVTSGPVRATLRGADHTPVVKRNWPFSVTVTDAAGHPLSGTLDVQFVYGGQVVGRDTPPTHRLTNGRWHENLQFPSAAVGIPLTFQVVAHTSPGTVTLDWPVRVKQ